MRRLLPLLLALAGCPGSGEWSACEVVDEKGAPLTAECASYTLPLSAERTDQTVDVRVRRFRDPGNRGQLWLLQGGPGGTGSSLIPLAQQLRKWQLGLDLYLPDHRGVGESHRLGCPRLEGSGGLRGDADLPACLDELMARDGAELPGYTPTEAARDVLAVIAATHQPGERLVIWGGSYGSYWAHRIVQLAPELLDGLVLDGVCVGPACRLGDTDARMDDRAHALLRSCAVDPFCAGKLGPDAPARLDEVRTRLASCTALARTDDGVRRLLAAMAARAPQLLPALAYRLLRCEERDVLAVRHFERTLATPSPYDGGFSSMLQNHIVLSELSDPLPPVEELRRREDGYAVSHGLGPRWAMLSPIWPRAVPDARASAYAVTSRTAVLVRSGGLDMLTPPELGDAAAQGIQAPWLRRHLFPANGHSLLLSSVCGDRLFGRFVQDPGADLDDSCLRSEDGIYFKGDTNAAQRMFGVMDAWDG